MNIGRIINSLTTYISEAVARIFATDDNEYPIIGVQPFEGDPFSQSQDSDW